MEDGVKTRSFRSEDYNYRRAFLRSYPLRWDEGEEEEEEEEVPAVRAEGKKGGKSKVVVNLKHRFVAVFQWGGGKNKVVLLRKLKNKVAFYLVACHPFGFKPSSSNHLLTV